MKKFVSTFILIFAAFFIFSSGVFAQDSLSLVSHWNFGGSGAFEISGNTAYVSFGQSLSVLDISDPADPKETAFVNIDKMIVDLALSGNILYCADSYGFHSYDVSSGRPKKLGGYEIQAPLVTSIEAGDGFVIIGDKENNIAGIRIFDVSDPASPKELGSVRTGGAIGNVSDIKISGGKAYLAGFYDGVAVVDISDKSSPQKLGSFKTGDRSLELMVEGNTIYTADGLNGLLIIDCSDPANMQQVGNYKIGWQVTDVSLSGATAFLSSNSGAVYSVDVSSSSSPNLLKEYNVGDPTSAIKVVGNKAYVSAGTFNIVDVSNPSSPAALSSFSGRAGSAYDLDLSDNKAYIASNSGLKILDVSTPQNPSLLSSVNTDKKTLSIDVEGSLAYMGAEDGLLIYDISDPTVPSMVSEVDLAEPVEQIQIIDGKAYLANGNDGLKIFDVSNSASPQEIGSFKTDSYLYGLFVSGNNAYLAARTFYIVDITDPANISELYSQSNQSLHAVTVNGNYAYVTYTGYRKDGIKIYDVGNPSAPTELGKFEGTGPLRGYIHGVFVKDNYAYVAHDFRGVTFYNIEDPSSPELLGDYDTGISNSSDLARAIKVKDNFLFVADGGDGVYVLGLNYAGATDVEKSTNGIPERFNLYQNYPNPFNPSTLIRYGLPQESHVIIRIYNVLGQEVKTLFDGTQRAGYYEKIFNGSGLASGIYIYSVVGESTVSSGKFSQVKKMLMVK